VDGPTRAVYEASASTYAARRHLGRGDDARAFGTAVRSGGRRLDLGCGPGRHLPLLGRPVVGLDGARAMLALAAGSDPTAPLVHADLADLPFDRGAFAGVWASKAHLHLTAAELPMALAEVHRVLEVGGRFELTLFAPAAPGPTATEVSGAGDDLPGRRFTWWEPRHLARVVEAAGFSIEAQRTVAGDGSHPRIELTAIAQRALPDHVGPGMALLCCGLNPSLHAADAGVGYVTGSNRFWRAMAAAGLATRDRDPRHLLRHHGIGMTDLVKRATARADELSADEYREGVDRLAELCTWLEPAAVAVVGLAGWRAAVDRRATVGWQERWLGPSPVYVLPSTSGLNAGTSLDDLVDHLRTARAGIGHR
jgi:TDG/mug DNA glycosylase family protein